MAVPDADALRLAELASPKLIHDGMFLAGLDIVADKMMEVNVDSAGGINMMDDLTGEDFSGALLRDLEKKVRLHHHYRRRMKNVVLSAL